jgi:hypothetical protein
MKKLRKAEVSFRVLNRQPQVPHLNQISLKNVLSFATCFRCNLLLNFHLRLVLPGSLFLSGVSDQNPVIIFRLSYAQYEPLTYHQP